MVVLILAVGIGATTAIFLALLGIHGVVSSVVATRRQEVGLRMVPGGTGGDVLWLFPPQGVGLVAGGLGAGILAALGTFRVLESLHFGVSETNPGARVAVAALLAAAGTASSLVPARRAAATDPARSMKGE